MPNKFTEEQYQNIVKLGMQFDEDRAKKSSEVIDYVFDEYPDAYNYTEILDMALAISNPLTREWAHDKFVEKEKKYYWRTKKKNEQGKSLVLFHGAGGVVQMLGPEEPLTESEIKAWGFNPEMFDKEEV